MGKNKACKYDGAEGCTTVPSYGFPGADGKRGTAVRCSHHKLPGMVDVVSKTCNWEGGCKSQASYGHLTADGKRDSAARSRCRQHREPGMVDVINKTCVEDDCSTRPCYGFPSTEMGKRGNPERCSLHKLAGMINVVGKSAGVPKKLICNYEGTPLTPSPILYLHFVSPLIVYLLMIFLLFCICSWFSTYLYLRHGFPLFFFASCFRSRVP